jgi:hypothetical protein
VTRSDTLRVLLTVCSLWTYACSAATAKKPQPNLADTTAGQNGNAAHSGGAAAVGGDVAAPIETGAASGSQAAAGAAGTDVTQSAAGAQAEAGHAGGGAGAAGTGGGVEGQAGALAQGGSAGESGSAGQAGAAGYGGQGAAGRPGRPGRCTLPRTCQSIDTLPFSLAACCIQGSECGYELVRPPELRDLLLQMSMAGSGAADPNGTCIPATKIFLREPGKDEQRVVVEGGTDQLITPACESRALLAFPLPGCCMPDNTCGISTYQIKDILAGLVLFPAPFGSVECVSATELNAQFRASTLAGFAQLPPTTERCDYADLNARLPAADSSSAP